MTWIQTNSGRSVDLLNPKPETIHLPDIAHALGRLCRYTGHTKRHYSVAEHSIMIARHLERNGAGADLILGALLHDAHEAYIGDFSAPLKAAVRALSPEAATVYGVIELRIDEAIGMALDVSPATWRNATIKDADVRILLDERDALLGPSPIPWWPEREGMSPLGVEVRCWQAPDASALWRAHVEQWLLWRKRGEVTP